MDKNIYFPCTHNASDVIRRQRDQAIYNPCRTCTLQKAMDNNNTLNNQGPSEGQVIQYINGSVQWKKITDSGTGSGIGNTGPTGETGPGDIPIITNYSYGTNGTGVVNSTGYIYNGIISLLTFNSTATVVYKKNGYISNVPKGVYIVSATIIMSSNYDLTDLRFSCILDLGNSSISFAECTIDSNIDTYFRTINVSGIIFLNTTSEICVHTSIYYIPTNKSVTAGTDDSSLKAVRIA